MSRSSNNEGNVGRKSSVNHQLPPRIRARKQRSGILYYYYDCGGKPRKEIPLGKDYTEAIRKWGELELISPNPLGSIITFKDVVDRYMLEILPKKAPLTRKGNIKEIEWLCKFFNDPPAQLNSIKPIHIRQYLDWRAKTAKVRANREKALFSHIWNMARAWGLTDLPNPCSGIKGFSEEGRNIYIEDTIFEVVWDVADIPLRDALDLAYLTGQRPADTLAMSMSDIRDNALMVEQSKTGKKLRITIKGELELLIKRIEERKSNYKVHTLALICSETGRPISSFSLRQRFDKARIAAAKQHPNLKKDIMEFQFRDLRAKAATDKADYDGMREAQLQLGHSTMTMTEHYVRSRKGDKVTPTR
ncbi:MAG: tyrosine-type recombinase/integrase [Pseudomonadota bacterium]|nr:tyrosine-type recombinase/integrase [Pseudomonadota bacterium]